MAESVEQRPVWAWIDQAALRHNARRALDCAAGRSVIGVVKADGYGHGAADVARAHTPNPVTRWRATSRVCTTRPVIGRSSSAGARWRTVSQPRRRWSGRPRRGNG
ncbi:MAG TPA: hypothetical protein EYQ27_01765 [Gemmatimonadetes bacterium]|nr:hypothetical protein [Gemmatimonadota bacterium]